MPFQMDNSKVCHETLEMLKVLAKVTAAGSSAVQHDTDTETAICDDVIYKLED